MSSSLSSESHLMHVSMMSKPQTLSHPHNTGQNSTSHDNDTLDITEPFVDDVKRSLRMAATAFGLAYSFRAGLSIIARLVVLLRNSPKTLLSLSAILDEEHLVMRAESVRQGLFVGGLVLATELVRSLTARYRKSNDGFSSIIGGAAGGLALLVLPPATRRTLALYSAVRLVQCIYRAAKHHGLVRPVKHGDSLLFALSSAQIMYSWVMRPDTLPHAFFNFILRTGPIHKTVLSSVRAINRGEAVDAVALTSFLRAQLPSTTSRQHIQSLILSVTATGEVPCSIMHPQHESCTINMIYTFVRTCRRVLPLYAALTIVPLFVMKLRVVLRSPIHYAIGLSSSLIRSLAFIGTFVSVYMGSICTSRHILSPHRIVYGIAGFISGIISIGLERHKRRSELALYTLPRALDAAFSLLVDRQLLIEIPFADVILFCASLAGLQFFFRHDSKSVPPLLRRLLAFVWDDERTRAMRRVRSFYTPNRMSQDDSNHNTSIEF